MTKFDDKFLDSILDKVTGLGLEGAGELSEALLNLADGKTDETAKLALVLTAKFVREFGPEGIDLAKEQILKLAKGKHIDLDMSDERLAHLVLAAREESEFLNRSRVNWIFVEIGRVIGLLFAALIEQAL
jgi:hypothetical protein